MSVRKVERRNRRGKTYFRYQARYRDKDGHLIQKTFRTKREAEEWEEAAATDLRRGEWTDPRRGRTTFEAFASEWIRTTVDLRVTTRARNEQVLELHLIPAFGRRKLGDILELDVRAFVAEQAASDLAPSTVAKHLRLLSQILGAAARSRYIGSNPCSGVKPPALAEDEILFLEAHELNRLADTIRPRFRAMVLLAGYRGPRWGELAGLKRSRLNLLKGSLDITEILVEVDSRFSLGPPKTAQGRRTVPLPPFLIEALDEHISRYPGGEFVFTSPEGKLLHRSTFAQRFFRPAVAEAGLNPDLTFHGLRHTAVSLLAAEGAQLNELAAIMGWSRSTAAAMAVRYAHLFPSRQAHLTGRIEDVFRRAEAERAIRRDDILMTSKPTGTGGRK